MSMRCIVDFEDSDFGSVVAKIRNDRLRSAVVRCVSDNGGSSDSTAFFQSVEELEGTFTSTQFNKLQENGFVSVMMDRWDAANLYGWNAHGDLGEKLYRL